MVIIYNISTSRVDNSRIKKILSLNNIRYQEYFLYPNRVDLGLKNILKSILSDPMIDFDDILTKKSKVDMSNIDFDIITYNEMIDFILENPNCLKRPVTFDTLTNQFCIGYHIRNIEVFIRREKRKLKI